MQVTTTSLVASSQASATYSTKGIPASQVVEAVEAYLRRETPISADYCPLAPTTDFFGKLLAFMR